MRAPLFDFYKFLCYINYNGRVLLLYRTDKGAAAVFLVPSSWKNTKNGEIPTAAILAIF